MKITEKWLKKKKACFSSLNYVVKNNYMEMEIDSFIRKLIKEKRLSDADWLITKSMNKKQNVLYAVFAAELVINIFEKKYPQDKRPRKAIETAKRYVKRPCKQTKNTAHAAAYAAHAAAYAAYADADACAAAADAAAYAYAADAALAAADACAAATIKIKILKNGLKIIKGK